MEQAEPHRAELEAAAVESSALATIAGAVVERKGFAVAVHYRQVAEERQARVARSGRARRRRAPAAARDRR